MEEIPDVELINSLKSRVESLQGRIRELETENAKLSVQLSSCVCQKIVESDKTPFVDCCRLTEEIERQRLDENDVKDRSKEQAADTGGDESALDHFPKRYVALKVMYFGQRFYGFASEAHMDPTIESEIFKALRKTRLISGEKKELQYSRCGRTDKGVSSVDQVISLFLRSNLKETARSNGYSGETFVDGSCGVEIDYVKVLNRVLPKDIRIIGWSPAPIDFSARFSCASREYKYFFWKQNLNVTAMEVAGKKFTGEHDFRNFCKMDAANVRNYRRHITSFEILQCNERYEDHELWAVKIRGSAFLWHQIRCMVAVLFLIGQGLESSNVVWIMHVTRIDEAKNVVSEIEDAMYSGWCYMQVIDELLDVEMTQRKPQYGFAPEIPLVLRSCEFEGLSFKCSSDAKQALRAHFEKECRSYKLQAAIFHEALLSSSCVSSYENNQLNSRNKKKEPTHIPLMSRPTEPTYEERRAKLDAGGGTKKKFQLK